jgi:hypothetical protein
MAARKSHHYVPQFYLRRFSLGENGKTIGVYNHKNDRFIPVAAIRHQACENYLYGEDDDVESLLSKLESTAADLTGRMLKHFLPPADDSVAYKVLLRYLLYQHSRTLKSGDEFLEGLNQALKTAFNEFYGPDHIFREHTVDNDYATLMTLVNSDKYLFLLDFMTCKLVVNLSYLPFITSDNPVVTYNQYLEKKQIYIGAHGLPAKGLQLFLPIHPRMMICIYDPAVYDYGEDGQYCIQTESEDEIHQFNSLQYLNSDSQLFFNDFIVEDYPKFLHLHFAEQKAALGPYSHMMKNAAAKKIMLNASKDPLIGLSVGFIAVKKTAMDFNCHENFAPVRHESLVREVY